MSSFWCQFKVLLWRNIILKRRNRAQLIQEFLMPLFFVILLSIIKGLITPTAFGEHESVGPVPLNSTQFHPNTSIPILVAPNTSTVESIMDLVSLELGGIPYKMMSSQEEAEKEYLAHPGIYSLGIIFNYHGSNLSFAIRTRFGDIPDTQGSPYVGGDMCRQNKDSNQFDSNRKCTTTMYLYSGFTVLQRAVATALIQVETAAANIDPPDVHLEQMPMPSYQQNFSYILILSSMYFVLAYSPFINFLTVNLVGEKERKIKEGMRMMGMRDSAFWLAWGAIYTVIIIIVSIIVMIIALIAKFFINSNLFILFLILLLYGLTIINISFMVTPFFSKARSAGVVSSMASMLISVLYLAVSLTRTYTPAGFQYSIGPAGQWALCLLSPVAMALAMDRGLYLDLTGEGMTFDSMSSGDFPLYAPLLMMFIDFILYGLLAVYFDNVIPTEYGQRRSPFFFLQPSYWCGQKATLDESSSLLDRPREYDTPTLASNIEPVAADIRGKEGLRISHLRKVFGGTCCNKTQVAAVDGLTLDMYEGQITGVLGHNGAGKTTLINILTGMTEATSGRATILGLDVSNPSEMSTIRTMTGVCPQHNILFDTLSAREHLEVYAGIKGIPAENRKELIEQALLDVDLADQGDTRGKSLSGGQKRKLSVAIALIGDPKVIFLDEPTAGMDPYSRRHLWSLLTARKQGKIILLTTHFMDEADILADRKAIIAKGQLKCCGSSLFLKNKFGIGYHLNIVLEEDSRVSDITSMIHSYVPDVSLVRSHGKELAYTLPFEAVNKFPELFTSLEESQSDKGSAVSLGISSYGVSMTTLEEVFLRLGDEFEESEMSALSSLTSPNKIAADTDKLHTVTMEANSGTTGSVMVEFEPSAFDPNKTSTRLISTDALTFQRFKALFFIRFLQQIREPATVIFQLALPVVYVAIGIVISNSVNTSGNEQSPQSLDMTTGLGYYVQMRGHISANTPLLFENSAGPGGQALEQVFSSLMHLDEFNSSTDLLKEPHNLGVNITMANLTTDTFDLGFTGLFNATAVHAIPVLMNLMLNSMYHALTGFSNGSNLMTFSLPWNSTEGVYSYDGAAFGSAMLIAMAFVAVPTGFTSHIVRDKECHGRSQLRVSGVTHYMYWGTYYLIYQIMYLIPTIIILIIIPIAQIESLLYGGAMVSLVILLFLYMPMNILFSFIWSFAFTTLETAQTVVPNMFIFGGMLPYLAVSLVDMQGGGAESTASTINLICCIIDPTYTVFGGIYYIGKVHRIASVQHTEVTFGDYFQWDSDIPICLLMTAVHCVWMFLVIRVLEVQSTGGDLSDAVSCTTGMAKVIPEKNADVVKDEDSDVANERQRVAGWPVNEQQEPVVMVKNLRKEFEKESSAACSCFKKSESAVKVAVRNTSFAVEAGEVFGLLGPNGAGKTTTLNMIQAEIGPTCGEISVAGYNVRSSLSDAFQQMGSCPQHDALWDRITLREHIWLYGLLKGISKTDIADVANYYIESLQIQEHADKHAKTTSGGTKRKTCYAISMLGRPKIVLLDEPSTGMDPKSKRFLWDTISSGFRSQEKGGILTTHYMEEADVLCSRVAIMVNGQMQCIGSTQHLKNKYGSGYVLEVKLSPQAAHDSSADQAERMTVLDGYIKSLFDQAECAEMFGGRAMYKIPQDNIKSLSHVFTALEQAKSQFGVSEYSFSQSSLEQVFLEFAKKQIEEGDSRKFEAVDKVGEGVNNPNFIDPANV